jgi:hypothetical protein
MERRRQYGLTGVTEAILPPFIMAAKCAAAGVPWVWSDEDVTNAFNSASQSSLARSVKQLGRTNPEWAACAIRDQCMTRGAWDMPLRGQREQGSEPLTVDKSSRGCPQGSPASPPAFAGVMCEAEEEAEGLMDAISANMPASEAADALWAAMRAFQPTIDERPSAAWVVAVRRVLDMPRPGAWGGVRGEASSAYLDDTRGQQGG